MYSRYPNYRFSGGVRIPDNYSGNAFGAPEAPPRESAEEHIGAEARAEESAPVEAESARESAEVFKSEKEKPRFPSFGFGLGRLFSGGFGFEELLIIGLILLIAQSGTDDDIILLLALLLFIG